MCLAYVPATRATAGTPLLHFSAIARTTLPQDTIVWDGTAFVYGGEAQRILMASDAQGQHVRPFITLPRNRGEIRCVASPGAYGFAAGAIYCGTADGEIYRIGSDGHSLSVFARLPTKIASDGELVFDTGGSFGHALLAASGGSSTSGGAVYAVASSGQVRRIGGYSGPGGADNIAIAPPGFGPLAGQVLISEDQVNRHGRLLAMDPAGSVHVLLTGLANGLNPLVVITGVHQGRRQGPAPGLYLSEWISRRALFAPAAQLQAYVGDVLVGTEHGGQLFVVQPSGGGYRAIPLQSNLQPPKVYLEGATFIGG